MPIVADESDNGPVNHLLGGRYQLICPIGKGGMAVVWRARDQVLGRVVAVKVLAAEHAGDPDLRGRIRREAQAAAAISHPNIAQVHDYGDTEGAAGAVLPYVVMELIPGGTLLQRMADGPLTPRFAMRVGAEIAAALAAAHGQGVVHRDVKPANIMLAPTGAKVVDFGIAAAIAPAGLGIDGEIIWGTPAYLAPERLINDAVEPASDVYALGVLLYLLFTGHSPWTAEDTTEMLSAHIYLDPPPLPLLPGMPEYVIALSNRCLVKDPSGRPSARQAAAVLAQGAGLQVVTDDRPSGQQTGVRSATATLGEPSVVLYRQQVGRTAAVSPESRRELGLPVEASVESVPIRSGMSGGERKRKAARWASAAVLVASAGVVGWRLLPHESTSAHPSLPLGTAAPVESTPLAPTRSATSKTAGNTATAIAPPSTRGGQLDTTGSAPSEPAAAPPPGTTAPAGTQPAPTRTTTGSPTSKPPQNAERTFTSDAGSVRARCPSASTAQILSSAANSPYKVDEIDSGPGAAPSVTFKHGNSLVTMTVTCDSGTPSADVT